MKDVRKLRNHYPEYGERVLNLYLECNFREWADANPIIWLDVVYIVIHFIAP
jgi:hypothetical protein